MNSFCHFQPFPKITLFCADQQSPAQVLRFQISQIGWAGLGWAGWAGLGWAGWARLGWLAVTKYSEYLPGPGFLASFLCRHRGLAAAQRHGSSSCYFLSLYSPASPFIAARHRWPRPYIETEDTSILSLYIWRKRENETSIGH